MEEVRTFEAKNRWVMLVVPGLNIATLGMCFLLFVHTLVWMRGIDPELSPLYRQMGASWLGVKAGNVVGLLTHSLFHADWWHVGVNAFLFFYAAARLSHVLRASRIMILFLVSSLAAAVVHILGQALLPGLPQGPIVGASGGVMGMFLAVTVLYPDSKMLLLKISAHNMGKGFLIASALLFVMTPELHIPLFWQMGDWLRQGFGPKLFQKIGHLYHFAGGLVGMLLVMRLLPKLVTLDELQEARATREAELTSSGM